MAPLSPYAEELRKAMVMLALDQRVMFLGQAVGVPGTAMRTTLEDVPAEIIIELPVEEDFQLGLSIGLALRGNIVVSVFPRFNFLLLAMNQLVNHLDKMRFLVGPEVQPRVIVRTSIGSEKPLDPGPQHKGDMTEAIRLMCPNIDVVRLDTPDQVLPAYRHALERTDGKSTVLVEWGDLHAV